MAEAQSLSHCGRELRRGDRDRYLASLFAPADRREDLFALYAFNLEVARTAEAVSEAMLGRIRLQWWREAVAECYDGRPRRHAVVQPLAAAIRRHGLSRAHFDRLLEARELDLEAEGPADLKALEDYAEATASTLLWLALEVLGETGAPARDAARHLGIAWALTGLLRAVPFHAGQRRLYLPRDLMDETGSDPEELFALRSSPGLREAIERVAARAREHLAAARALRREVPAAARIALLSGVLAEGYLAVLARAGHDPFAPAVQSERPGDVWRLALARAIRRY